MNILETLLSSGGGDVVKQLAGQFGLNTEQASEAVSTALPALAGGLKEKLAADGGAADMIGKLISGGSLTSFLDNPSNLASPAAVETGTSLLKQIFGGGDLTNLASGISEKAGVGSGVIMKMLPVLMTVLGAFLSKNAAANGNSGNLTDMLGALTGDSSGLVGAVKGLAAKIFG